MKTDKLVIIGNGFDLHFKLPTRYDDFEKFISSKYPQKKEFVEFLCSNFDWNDKTMWSDFENNIAKVDKEHLVDNNQNENAAKEIYCDIRYCAETLKELFESWVKSIDCTVITDHKSVVPDCFFVNFNYTSTLEKNFSVNSDQIYHIHGTAKKDIVFGHKQGIVLPKPLAPYDMDIEDAEQYNEFSPAIIEWLNEYLKNTEKPVDKIIEISERLFECKYKLNFDDIKEVFVIGFSYSEVDMPYLTWINSKTKARWKLGYHSCVDCYRAQAFSKHIPSDMFEIKENDKLINEILV